MTAGYELGVVPLHSALRWLVVLLAICSSAFERVAGTLIDGGAANPKRLSIRNGCMQQPVWIAHMAAAGIGVDPQNIKIEPGATFEFQTPAGLSATRYWPKMGCNEQGTGCSLGGSGGPGEACVRRPPEVKEDDYSRCAPPIDTKFEGTFDTDGFDYVDMSLVDGWTLPFTLDIQGGECVSQQGTSEAVFINCSGLTLQDCPMQEKLSAAGISVDLRAVSPHTKETVGCYAPCQKLVDGKFGNKVSKGRHNSDPEVAPYCCPTPPESPEACRAGPIIETSFLEVVHTKCPGVYGYAYDDGMGLLKCTSSAVYELTFLCPHGESTEHARKVIEWPSAETSRGHIDPGSVVGSPGDDLFGHELPDEVVKNIRQFIKEGHRDVTKSRDAVGPKKSEEGAKSARSDDEHVWLVSNPHDKLFGRRVPDEIVLDTALFKADGDDSVVDWKGSRHRVRSFKRSELERESVCGDSGKKSCEFSKRRSWAELLMRKVGAESLGSTLNSSVGTHGLETIMASVAFLFTMAIVLGAARFLGGTHRMCQRQPTWRVLPLPQSPSSPGSLDYI